jgi:nitrogen fixation protein NifW
VKAFPELAGLSEAEEFFDALGVRYDARVLAAHRLQVMRTFGVAARSWLESHADPAPEERRAALAEALRAVHDVFAEPERPPCPFGPPLVRLGRRT